MVDISDINKVELLRALWNNSTPAAYYVFTNTKPPEWDNEKATTAIGNGFIDYFQGRLIKADLSCDQVNPSSYDRDNGRGALSEIVNLIRSSQSNV